MAIQTWHKLHLTRVSCTLSVFCVTVHFYIWSQFQACFIVSYILYLYISVELNLILNKRCLDIGGTLSNALVLLCLPASTLVNLVYYYPRSCNDGDHTLLRPATASLCLRPLQPRPRPRLLLLRPHAPLRGELPCPLRSIHARSSVWIHVQ